jgi:hypothetical protein
MKQERTYYEEARHYLDNADETLKKSRKEGIYYTDLKYVISALGIAYAGVESAAKWYLKLKGVPLKSAKVDQIKEALSKTDKKMLNRFNNLYTTLHIEGYYGTPSDSVVIALNLKRAKEFIEPLKHYKEEVVY